MAVDKAKFVKLVRTVSGSAAQVSEAGSGEPERVLDGLKALLREDVTLELLSDTEAGKKLKKLSKHNNTEIAAAAMDVVQCWKKKLKERASGNGGDTSTGVLESSKTGHVSSSEVRDGGGGPPGELRKIGNAVRDKVRQGLSEALKKDYDQFGGDPNRCAAEIEVEVFKANTGVTPQYKAKSRSLLFNLKDAKNTSLRRRILLGELRAEVLVTLPSEELANEEKRIQNEEIKKKMLLECERGLTAECTTDQFTCGKCKMSKCVYYQMQTRSADEPMTTFVTCTNCNNRWKFC